MSPENEKMYLHDILERKHKIGSDIEMKSEQYSLLKRREHHLNEEERVEMAKVHSELRELEKQLKDMDSELDRFNVS